MSASRRSFALLHDSRTAWIILAISLILTALAWQLSMSYVEKRARERFDFRVEDVHKRIATRMTEYEHVLRGGTALFDAQGEPTREQWRRYVATLQLERYYPGIQGMGYSKVIPAAEREKHQAAVRAEGYPDYTLRPDGERDLYSAIVYLEPFVARNLRAFGFDMYSEPTRRAAMSRARDEGVPAMSGMVTLVQEDGKDVQKGFLLYLPVYRKGASTRTLEERRAALLGWVYSPFRIKDLMNGILGGSPDDIDFTIYDGEVVDPERRMYETHDTASKTRSADNQNQDFETFAKLNVAGRTWTIVYDGHGFIAASDSLFSNIVAVGGLLIDLLLFVTIASMSSQKRSVEGEVKQRTEELRERTADLKAVFDLSSDGFVVLRRMHANRGLPRVEYVNAAFERLTGLTNSELAGLSEPELDEKLAARGDRDFRTPGEPNRLHLALPAPRILVRSEGENEANRILYFRDITREAEVDRMKSEFLNTAAHELRTPMVSILGFTELMLNHEYDAELQRDMHETIHTQTKLLVSMVNELLDIARIEARQGKDFKIAPVPVADLVRDVAGIAPEQDVRPLRIDGAGSGRTVLGDPDKTCQALLNLVSNGYKYSASPASVTVTVVEDAASGLIGLRVTDQGIGMTPAQLARAGERFYRADTSGNIPGTGLGLAIVKEIARLQGGRLDLESAAGRGTTATLWLRSAEQAAGSAA